jgi:hypothetical protein
MVTLAGSWYPKQTLMFSRNPDPKKITKTGMGLGTRQGVREFLSIRDPRDRLRSIFHVAGKLVKNIWWEPPRYLALGSRRWTARRQLAMEYV